MMAWEENVTGVCLLGGSAKCSPFQQDWGQGLDGLNPGGRHCGTTPVTETHSREPQAGPRICRTRAMRWPHGHSEIQIRSDPARPLRMCKGPKDAPSPRALGTRDCKLEAEVEQLWCVRGTRSPVPEQRTGLQAKPRQQEAWWRRNHSSFWWPPAWSNSRTECAALPTGKASEGTGMEQIQEETLIGFPLARERGCASSWSAEKISHVCAGADSGEQGDCRHGGVVGDTS